MLTDEKKAHVIVFGNEKGGSGKSTTAMHVAVGLLRLGFSVGTIDLDSHQATLTSYVDNRLRFNHDQNANLPLTDHIHVKRPLRDGNDYMAEMIYRDQERQRVENAIASLMHHDYIVIDTPGSDRFMSIIGHFYADTLVTPMNDSFVDLDLLAKVNPTTFEIEKPSVYAKMVLDLRRQRRKKDDSEIDWIVLRNRLSHLDQKNKRDVGDVLTRLSQTLGFRFAQGFCERVIFRELFLTGRTLLDLKEDKNNPLTMSNIAARQEVRYLIKALLTEKTVSTLSLLQTA
jgi:chromosome partitioning protein